MISVIVERYPADKQGPDISDALITSEAVAIERGRNEVDHSYTSRENVSGTGPYRGYMQNGKLVEVMDMEAGPWRGKMTGFSLSISRSDTEFAVESSMRIERVAP